jgi:hypothetical protein
MKNMAKLKQAKLLRGEKMIRAAVALIDKLVKAIISETTDEDIKYEVGKAWGIVKGYLNVN